MDFEKEDCRGVLHQMGCDQNMIDDILSVTTDTQVAARMALAKLGKGQSDQERALMFLPHLDPQHSTFGDCLNWVSLKSLLSMHSWLLFVTLPSSFALVLCS